MTNEQLRTWWPELGTLVSALRGIDQPAVADQLLDAVRGAATSGEVLGAVGSVLKAQHALRSRVGVEAGSSWDKMMADVHRAYPGARLRHWLARLTRRAR